MRLDKYLKVSRIIKRRTLSKEITEANRVKVNGLIAKPAHQLKVGDDIEINFGRKKLTIRVLILKEHVLKDQSQMLYEIIKEEKIEEENENRL
jgi:Ribosome-associated heat shock protein implicated in the recycling of the 50S subunit (S4 paralog)